jgi:hypothetical protein
MAADENPNLWKHVGAGGDPYNRNSSMASAWEGRNGPGRHLPLKPGPAPWAGIETAMPNGNRWRAFGLFGVLLLVAACAHHHQISDDPNAGADDPANVLPARYKPEILAAMHAYLNDPTGIRDAGIAEPALKSVGNSRRFVVCLRLNARQKGTHYAGVREIAAVFLAGRFDHFVDPAKDACTGATYAPFPELQKLPR